MLQEALPLTATHETVRQQFKQFGNVAYVSLPKYRTSGRIKEFGFVEFEEKSSVAKCINAFRQFDGVIGDKQEPEHLKSVVAYMKEQDELEKEGESEKLQTETSESGVEKETVEDKNTGEQKTAASEESSSNVDKNEPKENEEKKQEIDTKAKETKEEKASDETSNEKNANIRTNEEPLSDKEKQPAKRLKTQISEISQISEDQQDPDDIGNTTDEKASVTDENQDQKTQK